MAAACWGFTNIKEGLDKKNTANYDSYSVKYYEMDDTYFKKYAFTISVVFSGPNLDFSNIETQNKIEYITKVSFFVVKSYYFKKMDIIILIHYIYNLRNWRTRPI